MTIVDEKSAQANEADPGPAMRPELEQALRREIEQAMQPVLADFRDESVRAVRQQVDEARRTAREGRRQEAAPSPDSRREERASPTRRGDRQPEPIDGAEGDAAEAHATALDRLDAAEIVRPVAHTIEELGTQWVTSSLEHGRDTLCSERTRSTIRDAVERTFGTLLNAGLEFVPGEATRRQLRQESEDSLDELVNDALEHVCSDHILAELQQHAESALQAFIRVDMATVLREIWKAVLALCRALLAAVQDQWHRLLNLVLHVLLKAIQEMVGSMIKEGLSTIVAVPVEEIEEKAETAKESVQERTAELRDRLAERLEALQGRVKEEVAEVKERVAEGLRSAVNGDASGDKFGRPPTGRPPSLRSPSGRPPSGRPPSGRPPSGRPPSLTRRQT